MLETGAKEVTILGLTREVCADLKELSNLLLASFDRGAQVPKETATPDCPTNVLDEIVANLADAQRQIEVLRGIMREALGKISSGE